MTVEVESSDIDAAVSKLGSEGTPYAVATVVRTLASTAARPGMKAVLLGDGSFAAGWLGGACVTSAVSKAAVESISSGEPRLVVLRPEELLEDAKGGASDGGQVVVARNGCPSKGSLDIFVEPVVASSEVLIFGCGPVADALSGLAGGFGFRLVVCGENMPEAILGRAHTALQNIEDVPEMDDSVANRYIVIATQGRGDLAAVKAAIAMPAAYIGLVASQRKFTSLAGELAEAGFPKDQVGRIKAPAGIDIKAVTPEEIALSILAEIVMARRSMADTDKDARDG